MNPNKLIEAQRNQLISHFSKEDRDVLLAYQQSRIDAALLNRSRLNQAMIIVAWGLAVTSVVMGIGLFIYFMSTGVVRANLIDSQARVELLSKQNKQLNSDVKSLSAGLELCEHIREVLTCMEAKDIKDSNEGIFDAQSH